MTEFKKAIKKLLLAQGWSAVAVFVPVQPQI
jgi:hypothetical protein